MRSSAGTRLLIPDLIISSVKTEIHPDAGRGGMTNMFPVFMTGDEQKAEKALANAFAAVAKSTPNVLPVAPRSLYGHSPPRCLGFTIAFTVYEGVAYMVGCQDDFSAAARLVVLKYVHALCALLNCRVDQLVVVPACEECIVVGTSASKKALSLLTSPSKLSNLDKCGVARYCSVECSRANWRAHKRRCAQWAAEKAAPA
ncbi:hypothetical protein WJX72_003996 [[Myrmecia] bisecta]|uniref:MYND-type domain-containing protein n=1 Tax=[Myrmecia] bisecta TaxID=41462 RepID=A0AAW1Q3T3_9CHLO